MGGQRGDKQDAAPVGWCGSLDVMRSDRIILLLHGVVASGADFALVPSAVLVCPLFPVGAFGVRVAAPIANILAFLGCW